MVLVNINKIYIKKKFMASSNLDKQATHNFYKTDHRGSEAKQGQFQDCQNAIFFNNK